MTKTACPVCGFDRGLSQHLKARDVCRWLLHRRFFGEPANDDELGVGGAPVPVRSAVDEPEEPEEIEGPGPAVDTSPEAMEVTQAD